MTAQPLISIVVPVYNVENYLRRCFESIVSQTYTNLEIILVDDGSTDGSAALCDELEKSDDRVLVIHRNNGGLSAARNTGLKAAKGQYIAFWDSDDWVEPNILEIAYNHQKEKNYDIVVWGYSADFVNEQESVLKNSITDIQNTTFEKGVPFLNMEAFLGAIGYAWNKLYKIDILKANGLFFTEGLSLIEDIVFNAKVFQKALSVSFIQDIGTHYIQRTRKTLGSKYYPNYIHLKQTALNSHIQLLNLAQVPPKNIETYKNKYSFDIIWSAIRNVMRADLRNYEKRTAIKTLLENKDIISHAKQAKLVSLKEQIKCLIIATNITTLKYWAIKLMY